MNINKIIKIIVCITIPFVLCFGFISCMNEESRNETTQKQEINNPSEIKVDDYTIISNGDSFYIVFDNTETYTGNDQSQLATVEFETIKEFKDSVTKGKLSDFQKKIIATSFPKNDSGIMCCDFNNLYEPKLPAKGITSGVSWGGESYSFYLGFSNGIFGYTHCYTKSQYDDIFRSEYENYFNRDTITVNNTEKLDGGKEATYYSTSAGELMQIRYTISNESKTFIVDKTYRVNMTDSALASSSSTPSNITLYCTQGGVYYVVDLFGFAEDPSDEWLMDFGISRYVENNSEIK